MNFRNISAWCIRNPVPPIVFFVGLMLAGIVSFMTGLNTFRRFVAHSGQIPARA